MIGSKQATCAASPSIAPSLAPFLLRTEARQEPYTPGGRKRWWLTPADCHSPHSARVRAYCCALLSAADLECSVPHLAELPVYLQLVDPQQLVAWQEEQQARKKRQHNVTVAAAKLTSQNTVEKIFDLFD